MKRILKNRKSGLILHILVWSTMLLLPYFVSRSETDYRIGIIPGLLFTVSGFIHMAIFYGNAFFLYPGLYNRRYWWLYIISSIALVAGSVHLKFYIMAHWFSDMLHYDVAPKFAIAPTVVVFIISIIYRNVNDSVRFEREQKEKEADRALTELKFLRSQISPHFLFNVLTNLVSLARKKSDRLEKSLIMLSDLMRYMLYDTQGNKVGLEKEVEFLNSYMALQKLRFENDVLIDCDIQLNQAPERYTIEPMLLIPFVENAFKHVATCTEQPEILIRLSVHQGVLVFETKNNFSPRHRADNREGSGIGLNNVRSRLKLLYRDNYTLNVTKENNVFHITLTLKMT